MSEFYKDLEGREKCKDGDGVALMTQMKLPASDGSDPLNLGGIRKRDEAFIRGDNRKRMMGEQKTAEFWHPDESK